MATPKKSSGKGSATARAARSGDPRSRANAVAAQPAKTGGLRNKRLIAGLAAISLVAIVGVGLVIAARNDTSGLDATDWTQSLTPPPISKAENRAWSVTAETNQGTLGFELDGVLAPQAVASFVSLANAGFFDDTECHRLTTAGIYVLQCGDPAGTGLGGPLYFFGPIENAPADGVYPAGTIAMARRGDDGSSMGSQFFIVYKDSVIPPDLAGGYTVFGTVTVGLDIVELVANTGTITGATDGRPAKSVIFTKVTAS